MKTFIKISVLMFGTLGIQKANAQTQQFTTAGTHTFTIPSTVISLKVECVGAGGAGGRVTPSNILDNDAAGGGGGGAYIMNYVNVTGGSVQNVVVGAGGINDGNSTNGGNSLFGDGSQALAEGGKTRNGNDNEAGVEGGKAVNSTGLIKFSGGNGGNGNEGDVNGGGGGGAAGSGGNGFPGTVIAGGGMRNNYGGSGGSGGADGASGAAGGTSGGGGGGSSAHGSSNRNGGKGASGIVVLSWCEITNFTPASVCTSGQVIITGTNFTGVDSVFVNGLNVPFTANSSTQITITIPATATSGAITVSTENGRSRTSSSLVINSQNVGISVSGMQLTAQYAGTNASYQWIDCINGNTPIQGAQSSTFTATQNGLYAVKVTENGCTATSSCQVVNTTGIDELTEMPEITVFPNPSSGSFSVVSGKAMITSIRIFNLDGKEQYTAQTQSLEVKPDINNLADGLYFIETTTGENKNISQIILKK